LLWPSRAGARGTPSGHVAGADHRAHRLRDVRDRYGRPGGDVPAQLGAARHSPAGQLLWRSQIRVASDEALFRDRAIAIGVYERYALAPNVLLDLTGALRVLQPRRASSAQPSADGRSSWR